MLCCNFLKRAVQQQQLFKAASLCSKAATPNAHAYKPDTEVKDALDIEASLFGNSARQHKPASLQQVLAQRSARRAQTTPTAPPKAVMKQKQPNPPKLIQDPQLGFEFYRLQLHDPLLNPLLTTARSRKRRDQAGQIVVEGRRLIREALECQLQLETLLFSQMEQLLQLREEVGAAQSAQQSKIYKVPQHDLKLWSTLTTPPGLLAIFRRPGRLPARAATLPITVICDNVREPSNLGSIVRSCAAVACEQLVVTRGCCDPWETKALRGGCGGQFRVPIWDGVAWEELPQLLKAQAEDCCVYIAENNGGKVQQTQDYTQVSQLAAHNIVIIGGESHGVSEEAYGFMQQMSGKHGKSLHIPLANGVESLNVASALTLILYEIRKQLVAPAT